MKKGISGDHFFRTHLANPSRRSQSHLADLSRYPQADGSGGAMELSGPFEDAQTAIASSSVAIDMKNTINIDKYMKRFMAQTTMVIYYNSCNCRVIIK